LCADPVPRVRVPTPSAGDVALALAAVSVQEEIAILVNSHDDMTESSNIGHATENVPHVLPSPADRIAGVGMPTEASPNILFSLATTQRPVSLRRGQPIASTESSHFGSLNRVLPVS